MTEEDRKVCCSYWRCGWVGKNSEVLTAPDPFNDGSQLTCCPKCRDPDNRITYACDYGGCDKPASSGTPAGGKYFWRCHDHRVVQ